MPKRPSKAFSKRLAKVERELKADKPEVKTLDALINPLTSNPQYIGQDGIYNGVASVNYDLTRGFVQGLQNDDGNIDGNYCKLTSMDLRMYLRNANSTDPVSRVRLMIVRTPNAEALTPGS